MNSENLLVVKFKSNDDKFFELKYLLFDNPFVEKWQKFFWESRSDKSIIFENGAFYGASFYTEPEVRNEIIKAVEIINSYKANWIELVPHENMSQTFLSALHDDFERLDHLLHYDQWKWPQRRDFFTMLSIAFKRALKVLFTLRAHRIRDPVVPHRVVAAVTRLNVLIHRYESLGVSTNHGHIDVLYVPVKRKNFSEEDYKYFSCNNYYGGLYLAYGVTGVPPLDAFQLRSASMPVPQTNYTTGMRLSFIQTREFTQKEELTAWYKEKYDWDAENPKLALGYIQLGQIQTDLNEQEIIEKITEHRFIHSVELRPTSKMPEQSLLPAIWPNSSDILYHLKYRPYIELPVIFDHKACLSEASALLDKFVVHRNYDQTSETTGKWKSLGINALDGDSSKTLNHPSYGVTKPQYSLTDVARQCPETFAFLESITDLSQCQRVRFMLLEPGAKISPHSDSLTKDMTETTLAVNIALNMPEGCEFWSSLNSDGSKNAYSSKLPMKAGSLFIFNNSQFHSVQNNSNVARIHIIIHGPLRVTEDQMLAAAQKQNNLFTRKALLNQVVKKFTLLGCELPAKNKIYLDWLAAGHDGNLTTPEIALAVVTDRVSDGELMLEATHNFTLASIFPERPSILCMDDLSSWLKAKLDGGAKYAALVGSGTFLLSANLFILEIFKVANKLVAEDALLAGHLMHRNSEELPFLHEQFLMLDLEKWSLLGCPSLSEPYAGTKSEFPAHRRSRENIHDDYTPLWICSPKSEAAGTLIEKRQGREGWCTALMARAIESGKRIINVPTGLRNTKKFSYPRAGRDWQYIEIKRDVDKFLGWEKNNFYVVNNEPLAVTAPENFKPNQLISVSAGLKPAALVYQFWKDSAPEEINIVDFSKPALDYMQELTQASNPDQIRSVMKKWFAKKTKNDALAAQMAEDYFNLNVNEAFEGDFKNLIASFEKLRRAKFVHADVINNPSSVCALLKPGLRPYFWHSNAFTSNASLYLKSESGLRSAYQALATGAAAALKQPEWISNDLKNYEVCFGNESIEGLFSAGYGRKDFNKKDYSRAKPSL